ncbi:MAG: tetratricopeptide repeat protein, partial [Planctomycetota bacterium]
VAACARCGATLRAYRHIETSYRELPELEPRPELAARILAGAAAELRPVRPLRRRLVLVAAGLALVLVPLALYLTRERAPSPAPQDAVTELLQSGDALRDSGRFVEARVAYEGALAQAPADLRAKVLHRLAQLALVSGDLRGALTLLEDVCAQHPDYSARETALLERARTLAELHRTEEARQAYASILSEFPGSAAEVLRRLDNLPDEQFEHLQGLGYVGY